MNQIRDVSDGVVVEREPTKAIGTSDSILSSMPDIELMSVAQVMGLEGKQKNKYKDQLKTILDWAKSKTEDHSPVNLKWVVRDLSMRISSTPMSEPRITRVARFAYLELQGKKIEAEKHSLMD